MNDNFIPLATDIEWTPESVLRGTLNRNQCEQITQVIKVLIQIEMLKAGVKNEDRFQAIEKALENQTAEVMKMIVVPQREQPIVEYVYMVPSPAMRANKPPRAMIAFYSLGLISSLGFALLLALSALGTNVIHPFLELLGFVGGLGWLTTAWADLLSVKREKFGKSSKQEAFAFTSKEKA